MKFQVTSLRKIAAFFDAFVAEMLIIFSFLFLLNNYLGNNDVTINADGVGYYDYLPSLFIRGDFNRKDISYQKHPEFYSKLNYPGVFVEFNDRVLDKYPVGTALLQSPFFLVTKATAHFDTFENHGYQKPFQRTIFHAAIAYLFLTLIVFRRLLRHFNAKRWAIIVGQIVLVFATSVMHYTSYDASYSHVYSLFAISLFLLVAKRYFNTPNLKRFLLLCFCLALVVLLRQVNLIVIFILPFLAGSWSNFTKGVLFTVQSYQPWLFGVLIGFLTLTPQFLAWYFQTGHWIVYSYQGETFDFSEPHVFLMLFSYQKGLFVYAPVLFISFIGVTIWLKNKDWYSFFSYLLFFGLITYVFSSWWTWTYGCSYGSRVYVDFYVLLLIPLVLVLSRLKWFLAAPIAALSLSLIPLSVVQTLQYKKYILLWSDMNEKAYWEVFFRTDETYRGLLWSKKIDTAPFTPLMDSNLRTIYGQPGIDRLIYQDTFSNNPLTDSLCYFKFSFDNQFDDLNKDYFLAVMNERLTNVNYYYINFPLIHFRTKQLNTNHRGFFVYEIVLPSDKRKLELSLIHQSKGKSVLKNPRVEVSICKKTK